MPPRLRWELAYVLPGSLLFSFGAALVGYYGVNQQPVIVAVGVLLSILGYRVPQYLLYADDKFRVGISNMLGTISVIQVVSLGFGFGLLAYGIPLGANGFYKWNLALVVLSGFCFVLGYMLIHIPINNALL
jgi:hypothetical protein